MDAREQRGLIIAATCQLKQKGKVWIVPSQTGQGNYTVVPDDVSPHCSCPDHEATGQPCKHVYAARFVIKRERNVDGTITETTTFSVTQKKTYAQDWPAYNKAQVNEKSIFQSLLSELCKGIKEPAHKGLGRPPIPLCDSIFSAVFKVFSTVSARRFMCDLVDARAKGHVKRMPCYNSIFHILEKETTFDILKALVIKSAEPLKALESSFSCDSTGFSGGRFDRWYDQKYGKDRSRRAWVKAHCMTGVLTNCITAVEIHDQHAGDSPQLKPLLETTSKTFQVKELSADMAYSSHDNLETITACNATPLIPFKSNATPSAGGLWEKMFHYFHFQREEFSKRYHLRSNIESTFSMLKAKFGDAVRSKTDMAMKNEVLAKMVCHNICCIIQSMYEFNLVPTFWAEKPVAQQVVTI